MTKLEPGWLAEVLQAAREEVQGWPMWMRDIREDYAESDEEENTLP